GHVERTNVDRNDLAVAVAMHGREDRRTIGRTTRIDPRGSVHVLALGATGFVATHFIRTAIADHVLDADRVVVGGERQVLGRVPDHAQAPGIAGFRRELRRTATIDRLEVVQITIVGGTGARLISAGFD